jgi:GPH family glycoside/pentoside/hexuronide:cation symporter
LPFRIRLGWATGELAIAGYIGLTMAFMLYYCTEALKIPPALAGIALLIPRLVDAFVDPLMGAISDRTRSSMGRRRVYLLFGSILLGISFGAIFFVPPELPLGPRVGWVMFIFLLSNLSVSVFEVPYSAMLAEMTDDYAERTVLTGYKMMGARIGIILTAFVGPLIFRSTEDLNEGFRLLGLVAGLFMMLTGLWSFFATRQAPRLVHVAQRFSIGDEVSAVVGNRPFRTLWLAFLMQNLAIGAAATALIYFLVYNLRLDPKATGPFLAAAGLTATLATPVWWFIAGRLGKRPTYLVSLSLAAAMTIPAMLIQPSMGGLLLITLLASGVVDASNQLMPNAMVPDTVEVDQARTGIRREGALFGAWGFCRKLGMTAGAFLVSVALAAFGFVQGAGPDAQTAEALFGIRAIYTGLPLGLWLAAIILLTRYDLTEARFNELKAEILARERLTRP